MFLRNRYWNCLNREILAGKCLHGRGKALRVCARDKLWRRTGRTGAVTENSLANLLLNELLAAWASAKLFAADWDLIHFHVNRNSKETFEASHRKCVIMFTKNQEFFLQGKQIKGDVLVKKTLKISYGGNFGRVDLFSLRVVIRDFHHFVIQINPPLLYFPIKSEKCGHFHVLQAYSHPISGSLFSVSPIIRPLVWSLLFTFKCWIKEHKHIEKKKRKIAEMEVLSSFRFRLGVYKCSRFATTIPVKPVWTLTGMTSDSLKRRFGLPDYLTSQLTTSCSPQRAVIVQRGGEQQPSK